MFERKHEKVAPPSVFAKRILGAVGLSLGLVVPALFILTPITHRVLHKFHVEK